MDLNLSAEQVLLRDTFRTFFGRECPTKVVRAAEPSGFDQNLWDQLRSMEAPGLGASSLVGGGDGDLADLCLVAEELGGAIAPVPLIEHTVALRLLERAGADRTMLDEAVPGRSIVTVALHPGEQSTQLVPAGAIAAGKVVWDGSNLRLVESPSPGSVVSNLGGLPLSELGLLTDGTMLASGDHASALHASAVDEWRILTAAALVGLAESALAIGVDYVRTRQQFGVPIGSFQAVAHGLAELRGPLNGARLLTWKAAWSAQKGDPRAVELARMALAFAADVAQDISYRCMHFHGGYGVMEEYDIQLYFRRARGWPQVLHDTGRELRSLADQLFGSEVGTA